MTWTTFKSAVYLVGYTFICAWIMWQNYSLVQTAWYWDILVAAYLTMSVTYMVWVIGAVGIIREWQRELSHDQQKEDSVPSDGS